MSTKARITYCADNWPSYVVMNRGQCRDETDQSAYDELAASDEDVIQMGKVCVERLPNKECEGLYVRCTVCGEYVNESEWEAHASCPCETVEQGEPEEWFVRGTAGHETHGQSAVYDSTGDTVAVVFSGQTHGALIAAAPDLRAALEAMIRHHDECAVGPDTWNIARVALARATGQEVGQ